ncbi:MAG: flagellar hook-length control protein FliK [Pseudomonadales bacterium]|nr:flagellar hook-length control protein FliK [Pseudomonadales bacterium]
MSVDLPSNLPGRPSSSTQSSKTPAQNIPTQGKLPPQNSQPATNTTATPVTSSSSTSPGAVTASVIQVTQTSAQQFDVTIEIDGKQYRVTSPTLLHPGEQLKLETSASGGFKLLEISSPNQETLINNSIRSLISQQNSYQPLLSILLTLATPTLKTDTSTSPFSTQHLQNTLPPDSLKAINQLISRLPKYTDIQTPSTFKQTLTKSGLQLENQLANAIINGVRDARPGAPLKQSFLQKLSPQQPHDALQTQKQGQGQTSQQRTAISQTSLQNTAIQKIIQNDFKANLLKLMTSLIQSQATHTRTPNTSRSLQQIISLLTSEKNTLSEAKNTQREGLHRALSAELEKGNIRISPLLDTLPKPPLIGSFFMQAQATAKADTKQKSWMDNIVATLAKLTLSSLSRLQLHQLASLPQNQDSQTSQSLSLELPVLHQDQVHLFQIHIREEEAEQNKEESKEKIWKINLAFDIDPLGPIHIQLTMLGESASATIWAEQKNTVDFTHSHLGILTESLKDIGLTVTQIDCLRGSPPKKKASLQQRLVDIKT